MSDKVKKTKKSGIPTIKEILDMEFNLPDFLVGGFDTGEQYEKWLEVLINHFEKLHNKKSIYTEKAENIIDMLLIFLDKYPELFAENYGEVSRDMMKFVLYRHIDKCQKLVDKISQIEKDLNLPIH